MAQPSNRFHNYEQLIDTLLGAFDTTSKRELSFDDILAYFGKYRDPNSVMTDDERDSIRQVIQEEANPRQGYGKQRILEVEPDRYRRNDILSLVRKVNFEAEMQHIARVVSQKRECPHCLGDQLQCTIRYTIEGVEEVILRCRVCRAVVIKERR